MKLLVRELRTTERTNVIVLYLGGVSTLGAAAACAVLPGGFVVPAEAPHYGYLLGAGPLPPFTNTSLWDFPLMLIELLTWIVEPL